MSSRAIPKYCEIGLKFLTIISGCPTIYLSYLLTDRYRDVKSIY